MRYVFIVLWMMFGLATSVFAQVSIGIGLPGVSIGINLPLYPELVPVPGYPVYYAPGMNSNYFFYDGMYWVYQEDNWYASSWYNGPWGLVAPEVVPLFVLRIPVLYYRNPPSYFLGWQPDRPPRWGDHWGNEWAQHRSGWDRWNRSSAPAPAPLPVYQRNYSGERYPRAEQQQALHGQNYHYQPRDAVVRQHYQEQGLQKTPAPSQRRQQAAPQEKNSGPQSTQRSNLPSVTPQSVPAVPRVQPSQKGGENVQRSAPTQAPPVQQQSHQPQQGPPQREQQQSHQPQQEPRREQGQDKGEERGQERNR